MLPPTPIRRLLLVPLVVVIAGALAALTPAVALLTAAFNLIRRRTHLGREPRSRLLRVVWLGLVWSAGETAALTVTFCLWLASGFGGRLDTEPYQARNYALMKWFLDLIYRAAQRACGLSVTVTGPVPANPGEAGAAGDRPLIVLSRHAGPGDSLLLVHYLLSACERRPRVVMKATLQLDPSVDILANRVPNAFLRRARARRGEAKASPGFRTSAADTHRVDQIRRLAAGMGPRSALALFPEGGNWTPHRWRRAIVRLRRGGRPDLAGRAAAMPNVLPPHASGALAAIAACPRADVIFVAHTGLDELVSVRDMWRHLRADMTITARWWRVPAEDVPRAAGREDQITWLYDWWERIDGWITAEKAGHPAPGASAREPSAADPLKPDSLKPDPLKPERPEREPSRPGPPQQGGALARPAAP